jgi:D-arabinose 5-phosphate isomerase GutQ
MTSESLLPEEILQLARAVIERESASVALLADQIDDSFLDVVQTLLSCTGHVLVSASGTSRAVAIRLAHLLSCCGTPALFIHPVDSQHGLAGAVTARDVLLLISKGGETDAINHLAEVAKKREAVVIGLTENPESTLGVLSLYFAPFQLNREQNLTGCRA